MFMNTLGLYLGLCLPTLGMAVALVAEFHDLAAFIGALASSPFAPGMIGFAEGGQNSSKSLFFKLGSPIRPKIENRGAPPPSLFHVGVATQ